MPSVRPLAHAQPGHTLAVELISSALKVEREVGPAGAPRLTRGGWMSGYFDRSGLASAPWPCACQAALLKGLGRAAIRDEVGKGSMRTRNPCGAMDRNARLSASHVNARVRGSGSDVQTALVTDGRGGERRASALRMPAPSHLDHVHSWNALTKPVRALGSDSSVDARV